MANTDKWIDINPMAIQDGTNPTDIARVENLSGQNALDVNVVYINTSGGKIPKNITQEQTISVDPDTSTEEIIFTDADLTFGTDNKFYLRGYSVGGNNDAIYRIYHKPSAGVWTKLLVIRTSASKKTETFDFWKEGLELPIVNVDSFKVTVEPVNMVPKGTFVLKTGSFEVTILGYII